MQSAQLPLPLSLAALLLAGLSLGLQYWAPERHREAPPPVTPVPKPESELQAQSLMETREVPDPLAEKVAQLEQRIARLQRLIQQVRANPAPPFWSDQPEALTQQALEQLGKEAAGRARFESRVAELNQLAAEYRDNDYLRYGPERYRELETLYRQAKPKRGPQSEEDQKARAEALNRMVEEFPEAYETGVAVAEQALQEALNGNLSQVEAYLQTLSETHPDTNIVTEQGLEAVPTIQTFLARQYLEQGRTEEAAALVDQLAQNYPDSLIVEPGPGNAPSPPKTAAEIAEELRQQLSEQSAQ